VGFVVDKVALGQVFFRVLRFPLPIFIPPIAPQSPSSIICGCYNRPIVVAVPSGLSLSPLKITIKNKHGFATRGFQISMVLDLYPPIKTAVFVFIFKVCN
jgi:hypothetical protein